MLNLINKIAIDIMGRREEGQTFVEYALVIGGVSLLLLAAFAGLDGTLKTLVDEIKNAL